jgi:transitional endoplasmic reticulum ATPase
VSKPLDLPRAPDLPAWMRDLRDRYLQTRTTQFVLHGNVHDEVLCANRLWSMPQFLDAFFGPSGKLVVHYDPGRGIWFADDEHAARAGVALVASGFLSAAKIMPRGENSSERTIAKAVASELARERNPEVALEVLEELLYAANLPTAVVVHYADLVAPDGSASMLGFEDRTAAARLHRWSLADGVVQGDNLVLMLTETLPALSRLISRNPRVGALQVSLPGPVERALFLAHVQPTLDPDRGEELTRVTAGLKLQQIHDILSIHDATSAPAPDDLGAEFVTDTRSVFQKRHPATPLPLAAIAARKKAILEQECFGLIEVVDPGHGFEVVGGMEPIKAQLIRIADHVKHGRRAQVPMGVLFVGPMGTGKSFVAEAFAHESGLSAVKLKNFRDKWVGSTEANLEKVLNVVEGLGNILVIIDEGDRSLGGGDSDGGVGSRVIARLKEFMSDPSHRGRIIFVMMTNRPDKLDTDLKRPGRFDLKIPFFSPQSSEARVSILRALLRRHKIPHELPDALVLPIMENLVGYAAADLEAIVLLANDDLHSGVLPDGLSEPAAALTPAYLAKAARDFMPTRETTMIRYMELLAVHEASNRRLLPEAFKTIEVDALNQELAETRRALRL